MEAANMLQVTAYDLNDAQKVPIMKNWLGREGLLFIQTLTNVEKEAWQSTTGLFNVLKEQFRPEHNEMILSLQYCELHRKKKEPAQVWIGRLHIKLQSVITKNMIDS